MRRLNLFLIVLGLFGLLVLWKLPARAAAPTEIRLPDPWGQVGQEISIRAVEVGGLECAVMVSGVERRTSLWCRAR